MQSHTAIGRDSVTGHKPTGHAKDGARWPPIPETEPFPESELVLSLIHI